MPSSTLLYDTMLGKSVPRAPSVPKIWLDLAANLLGRDYLPFFSDPEYASQTVIEAARLCRCDGARVFLFPHRDVRRGGDGVYRHYGRDGALLGTVDIAGGWSTQFDDPSQIDYGDPEVLINYSFFRSHAPILEDMGDLKRLKLPSVQVFHSLYGGLVDNALRAAGGELCPIGDCNSGTLAFCVALLGMSEALIALITEPALIHALMDFGIQLSITQAKFMLDKGLRVLRYNDSVANMSVISPDMWRTFIAPRIGEFCREVHRYCPQARVYCHICGNVLPILDDLVCTGLDCIAPLDPMGGNTVAEVRRRVGGEMVLMGGVDTLSFINSTPEEIRAEARTCIGAGFRDGRYAVGSGCVVPRAAAMENLLALRLASEDLERK